MKNREQKRYLKLLHDSGQIKQRYKMYKAGRGWLFAAISILTFGAGITFGSYTVQANDVVTVSKNESVTKSENASDATSSSSVSSAASSVTLASSTSSAASLVAKTSSVNADVTSEAQSAVTNSSDSAGTSSSTVAMSSSNARNYKSSAATSASTKLSSASSLATSSISSTVSVSSAPSVSSAAVSSAASDNKTIHTTSSLTSDVSATSDSTKPATGASSSSDVSGLSLANTPVAADDTNIELAPTTLTNDGQALNTTADVTDKVAAAKIGLFSQTADSSADTAATASVTLSTNSMGYGNTSGDLIIIFKFAGQAGDVFTITIPANSSVYSLATVPTMPTQTGTTTVKKNADGSTTITNTLSTTGPAYSQKITLNQINNYQKQATPMSDIGTTTKTINYAINGTVQTPVTFTQTITPSAALSTPSRTYPKTTISAVLPNTDYVYNISVNEADGVLDDGYKSAVVNSAANYGGTTITIPVPSGFVLNSSLTTSLNGYTDGTTFTQPTGKGGNIIITVPAGSGQQNYQNASSPYRIAGSYDVTQTSTEQTLTASGPATMTQIINAAGDTLMSTASGVWTENILAAGSLGDDDIITVGGGGNSSTASMQLLLDNNTSNDPDFLNTFGFSTDSADNLTNAKITLAVPDGLDVTGIKVPASGATPTSYLPGTTSYAYTMTLADGTIETGTVAAGATLTPTNDSAIRNVVFTPNFLAAGAASGSETFTVYGKLSATYDNGTPVNDGDQLTSTIKIELNEAEASNDVTQTVIFPKDTIATVSGYKHQTNYAAGTTDAGSISLAMSGNTHQTANEVYEPTYYFVIPSGTTVTNISKVPAGGVVSEFLSNDGHMVVKIDFSGSGVSVTTQETYLLLISLANNSDAMPGTYDFSMYVTSPETQLTNKTAVTDTSFTDGDANAVQFYSGQWTILSVSTVAGVSLAQGNQDLTAVQKGTSYIAGDKTLIFYNSILNTSDSAATNAVSLINLPTIGDSQGSEYTFDLTGPVTLPSTYASGTALTATVLYSTVQQTPGSTVNTTGYVTADQVSDWSTIRSVIIEFGTIPSNTSTGRITITGTTANFDQQAGKTGYLQTAFYADDYNSSTTGKGSAAQITILNAPTVVLNNQSFVYDGTTKASDASNLIATVTLTDGSVKNVALTGDDITITNDGTAAHAYTYSLSAVGLSAIQAIIGTTENLANPTVTGTITITPYASQIDLSDVTITYDGTTKASDAGELTATLTVTDVDGTKHAVNLTSDDVTFAKDGTNAGTYEYSLTSAGIAALQAAIGNNYTLANSDVTGKVTITALKLPVSLNNGGFAYDGATKASQANNLEATVTLKDGSQVTVNLTSDDISVPGDAVTGGDYTYTLTTAGLAKVQAAIDGDNYAVTDISNGNQVSGTIVIASPPAVVLNGTSFTYDGMTKASDKVAGLTVNLILTTGKTKTVSLTNDDVTFVTPDGTDVNNYTYKLSQAGLTRLADIAGGEITNSAETGTIMITPAVGTVELSNSQIHYDGVTKASEAADLTATVTLLTANGTKIVPLTSNDIHVTSDGVNVNDYTYTLTPAGLEKVQMAAGNNYTIDDNNVTGKISIIAGTTAVNLTGTSFTYDGTTKASEATGLTATVNGTTVDLGSSDIIINGDDSSDAGSYTFVLSTTGLAKVQAAIGNNYTVSQGKDGTIVIEPAKITITAPTVSKPYDGNPYSGDLTAKVEGKPVKGVDVVYNLTDLSKDVNEGNYSIDVTAADADNPNYDITVVSGGLTITKAVTTAVLTGTSFTYDGTTKASAAAGLTATINGKNVDLDSSDITITSDNDSSNAGSYTFTLNATGLAKVQNAAGGNYTVSSGADGTITIDKAAVTITAPTVSKTYDGSPYSGNITAKVEGKPAKGADVVYSLTDVSKDINEGTYSIDVTATDADNPNYDITVQSGKLTIKAAQPALSLNQTSFTYDGKTKASEAAGLVATVTLADGTKTTVDLDSSDVSIANDSVNVGNYVYTLSATGLTKVQAAVGNNYAVDDTNIVGSVAIKAATANVSVNNGEFTYDGSTKASEAKNLVATVTLENGNSQTVDLTSDDIDVENDSTNAGSYTYQLTTAGIDKIQATIGHNYVLNDANVTGKVIIDKAKVTITAPTVSKTYDGKPYSDNLTATVSGQPVDGTNLIYSLTDVSKDIDQGTYPIDVLTNATDNSNYEVEVVNGSLTIVPAKTTVSLSGNETETYTGAQQQPKASYYQVALPNGQSYTLTDDDITLVSGGIEPGSYQVQLTDTGKQAIQQALGTDYEVSFTGTGTFVISPATAKDVTTNSQTIHYGDTTPDFTVTYGTGLTAASLTNDDFVFTNAKGQTITGVPTAVGVYSVTLNAAGIAKVEAANPDYTFTNGNFIAGTFTILSQNNPGKPGNGGEPGGTTNPPTGNKPGQPTTGQPGNSGKNESNSVSTTKSTSVNNGNVKSISLTNANQTRTTRYHANKLQNQKRLPQTSDSQGNPLMILGLSLMGMLLGLFGIRRKKDRF